jgi:predicted DNA-binding ArsR family transcriptional regulator
MKYVLGQKVSIHDMRSNFKDLGDILMVKFKQIEDCKEGLRDMIVY